MTNHLVAALVQRWTVDLGQAPVYLVVVMGACRLFGGILGVVGLRWWAEAHPTFASATSSQPLTVGLGQAPG